MFLTGFILCFKNLPWCSTLFYSIISFTAGISCSQWRNNSSKKQFTVKATSIQPVWSEKKITRRSRLALFCKKRVLKTLTKFTGKHQCRSLFFIKVEGLRLWKKRLRYRCFPVNFVKFLRTPFSIKHLRWLLLDYSLSSYLLPTHKKNHTFVTNSQYATWLLNKYSCL